MSLLLLFQNQASSDNSSITLFIGGHASNDSSINLFIHGRDTATSDMDLYLEGPLYDTTIRSLNLYIGGTNYFEAGSMTLVLFNEMIANSATLFIKGSGVTPGGLPYNSNLNLFINRMPSDALNLYLRGPGDTITDDMTLVITGAYPVTNSLNLVIPNSTGFPTEELDLYIHGF